MRDAELLQTGLCLCIERIHPISHLDCRAQPAEMWLFDGRDSVTDIVELLPP